MSAAVPTHRTSAEGLRIGELVADVARQFLDLPAKEIDRGIKGALRAISETIGFEHCVLVRMTDDRKSLRVTHRYDAHPQPKTAVGQAVPLSLTPWVMAELLAGREVRQRDTREMPAEAATDAAFFATRNLRALAAFPLFEGGTFTGSLSFISERPSDLVHLETLGIAVRVFARALDKRKTDVALAGRLELTELIGAIARKFIDVAPADIRSTMREAQRQIAELFGFERSNVYETTEDRKRVVLTQHHLQSGHASPAPVGVERPLSSFVYVGPRLATKEPFVLSLNDLPSEALLERGLLEQYGTPYATVCPMVVGTDVLGAVTFSGQRAPEPSVVEMLGVIGELFTNIVQRERIEMGLAARLKFEETLSQVGARLIEVGAESFEATLGEVLRILGEGLDFERVLVFRVTREGVFSLQQEWRAEGVHSFRASNAAKGAPQVGWQLDEIRQGRSVMFGPEDIPLEATEVRGLLARDGTRLLVSVPLLVRGEVIGCIGFHRMRSAKKLSEQGYARLRLVGDLVASALARRGAQVSLEQSERRFGQVVATALDGFAMVSPSGVLLEWTVQSEKILGWSRSEVLGSPFAPLVCSGEAPVDGDFTNLYSRAQNTPGNRLELSGRHRDGSTVPIELSISAIGGDSFGIFIRDITDRQRAELARHQAFEEISRLKREVEGERDYLCEELRAHRQFDELIGTSAAMDQVIELVESVATTPATVLLRGESGVGKELVARAVHAHSRRADSPLVKVNCATIPKELFESEFFGHVRGAFTGALKDRVGRFELADRGTIFLDEVGEIPLELQAKLLRVLQESEFERVGSDRTRKVDVRVIAATNRDLAAEAAVGRFRKDLYYRLSVFPIEVPPLRSRPEDIVPLADHFLKIHCRNIGRPPLDLDDAQKRSLVGYDWPGNVRELTHVIERAVILTREPPLRLHLALPAGGSTERVLAKGRVLSDHAFRTVERDNLVLALERCSWRVSGAGGAAELLGLSPSTLRDRIRAFEISRPTENVR